MNNEWFTVTVQIKGEAKSYESAGHGVKHRLMSAGFKKDNIKIVSVNKCLNKEQESENETYNSDIQDIYIDNINFTDEY